MSATDSASRRLSRPRPPKVHITYNRKVGDAAETRELPFVVGVLADFSLQAEQALPRVRDRRAVTIDTDNFDTVMSRIQPRLALRVNNRLSDAVGYLAVELRFRRLRDFDPENIAHQVAPLHRLLEIRRSLVSLRSSLNGNERLEELLLDVAHDTKMLGHPRDEPGMARRTPMLTSEQDDTSTEPTVTDRIVDEAQSSRTVEASAAVTESIATFVETPASGGITDSRDGQTRIRTTLCEIDRVISLQLNEIMHHPEFQKAEATWRGLWYLVSTTETSANLKIRILNLSKRDLLKDLQRACEFDQSGVFKKICEEEYGTLGGSPYAVLVGDYEFTALPEDIELLEMMSNVAAASHAPFITSAAAGFFNLDSFQELENSRDLGQLFDNERFAKWKAFRASEDARYVGLVAPRLLLRVPYDPEKLAVQEEFGYDEQVDGRDHLKYLWGNAAYAFAARLTGAFAQYGWCAAIRGVEGGGLISGLPLHAYLSDDGAVGVKCPIEIAITERTAFELSRLGFIPLCHAKGTDLAVFLSATSCHKPHVANEDDKTMNASLAAQFPHILAVSRFAHYVNAILRDKIAAFPNRTACETYLNKWISDYVLADDNASPAMKTILPLQEAHIEVSEIPGNPGRYRAVADIRIHY